MLLACFADDPPYITVARFPSHRLLEPSCNAGRDHRIASSIDGAATKPKTKAARSQSLRSLSVGMAVTPVVGVAFLLDDRQAGSSDSGMDVLGAPAISMATPLCGTRHRIDSQRMFGPYDRIRRRFVAPYVTLIFLVLPSLRPASLYRQRFARPTTCPIGRQNHRMSRSWWAAPSLRSRRVITFHCTFR